jgi:acyl dehydratase
MIEERLRPGDVIAEQELMVDEIDLFLFSAACWLPHRIHYDQEFARAEGLDAVPVHGPLQASWLIQLVAQWAQSQGARLSRSTVRHVNPAYPRERLHLSAVVDSVDVNEDCSDIIVLNLRITKPDGSLTTVGTATVEAGNDPLKKGCQP